jgi:hypothetical protein
MKGISMTQLIVESERDIKAKVRKGEMIES